MDTKVCNKCKKEKPISEFQKDKRSKDGLQYLCKICQNETNRTSYRKHSKSRNERNITWAKDNPEKIKIYNETYRKKHKKEIVYYKALMRWEEKQQILFHYSNGEMKCNRCGIDNIDVLTVNHINHNGAEHRKKEKSAYQIMSYLIKNNFPDGYEILCRNCNWIHHLENTDTIL